MAILAFVTRPDIRAGIDLPAWGELAVSIVSGADALSMPKAEAGDAVDCEGMLVPVFAVNAIPGNIPPIGQFLAGERGSGVFSGGPGSGAANAQPEGTSVDPYITNESARWCPFTGELP